MSRIVMVIVLSACLPFGVALAALKNAAPKGVDLSGRWKLSPELSEDPHAAVSVAREEMKEKEQSERRKKKGRFKGGGMRPPEEKSRMPPDGGDHPPPPGRDPRPDESGDGADEPKESPHNEDSDPLERAVTTPEEFAIEQDPEAFVLMTRDATDTCKTRQPGQVNVPGYGLAARKCGWDKAGFVVEVEPKNGPLNTTRYEIDKESGRLFVTSELKGERLPKISVKRIYVRVEPTD